MSVDATTVRRIAHLARIAVADEEVEHLQGELNAILAFVEQLSEVNVDGVESEIRWLVWKRVGVEGGAGVGKVFAEFDEFTDAAWLPGVWGSGTYKIMEERDIRARATIAYGKSGALFYFAVGQNF